MAVIVACIAALIAFCGAPVCAREALGSVFLVLMTEGDVSRQNYIMQDEYCLDPVLPRNIASCRIRVLAPMNSYYTESRIVRMSLDFQHPARPNTDCHVRWNNANEVTSWCKKRSSSRRVNSLPNFWQQSVRKGSVTAKDLIVSEKQCDWNVYNIRYYRVGLNGYPEQRPTVVFRTAAGACVAGIVSGRRANDFRTTEAPCQYNGRRRCRPLKKSQYDALIRDIEASETYKDFRNPN